MKLTKGACILMTVFCSCLGLKLDKVNYFESMESWGTYKKREAVCDAKTILSKQLYDQYIMEDFSFCSAPTIPLIIHQIWLGSPFPEGYREYQQSWILNHPGWQYVLWTEKEIDAFGLVNRVAYDRVTNLAAKSDIARYEILDRFGGLYVDTDFECLQPFDVLHYALDFYTGCVDSSNLSLLNGIIASRSGHPILEKCIEMIKINCPDSADAVKIMEYTGPYLFTRAFFETLATDDVGRCVIFPLTYFYCFPAHLRKQIGSHQSAKAAWVKKESLAIHWWDCSWQK